MRLSDDAQARFSVGNRTSTGLPDAQREPPWASVETATDAISTEPITSPTSRSILLRDLWCGSGDVAVAIYYNEVTVGNPDGTGVHADDYVHPIVILPELSDLDIVQIDWLAKRLDYLLSNILSSASRSSWCIVFLGCSHCSSFGIIFLFELKCTSFLRSSANSRRHAFHVLAIDSQ